jgi:hypothetical protein
MGFLNMKESRLFRNRRRFTLQSLAFAMIMLPPFGLYQAAISGNSFVTLALLGVIAAGMAVAIWVN